MSERIARITIGLPVYNGERYLPASLESVLGQSFEDFELVISDNASTDSTGEICRSYAEGDQRVTYTRNDRNIGGARNFNRVFQLSRSTYFKWHSHDDVIAERYLERCLEPLEEDPGTVMAYPKIVHIDANGETIRPQIADNMSILSSDPAERVRRLMELEMTSKDIFFSAAFGLSRRDTLATTGLLRGFNGSDQVLVLQMLLRGKFAQIEEPLYFRREHAEASMAACPTPKAILRWFDPDIEKRFVLPAWKLLAEHLRSIHEANIGFSRQARASYYVARRFGKQWRNFPGDIRIAVRDLFGTT